MSRVERLVKKLITLRFVVCPYCDTRTTIKNPNWKTVRCRGCGHRINVRFRGKTERVKVEVHAPSSTLVALRLREE